MTVLHISVATSGLPGVTKSVWCVRMAASLCDDAGNITDSFAANIRAENRHIETQASKRHGITTAQASRTGIDEAFVLTSICGLRASGKRTADRPGLINCARVLVAWSAPFVCDVISGLFARHGEPSAAWLRPGLTVVSLQDTARAWCKLPPAQGDDSGAYCRPTRDEAAFALAGLPARPLPHTVDMNLETERALYAALRARKALETEAAA